VRGERGGGGWGGYRPLHPCVFFFIVIFHLLSLLFPPPHFSLRRFPFEGGGNSNDPPPCDTYPEPNNVDTKKTARVFFVEGIACFAHSPLSFAPRARPPTPAPRHGHRPDLS
jgi:hypothetical protein